MAVLLGAIGAAKKKEYTSPGSYATESFVHVHRFINPKKPENDQFYIIYNLEKDRRFYTATSPMFKGTYEKGLFIKEITKWIKSIGQDPKAQYNLRITNEYKISRLKRGYKSAL